MTSRSTPIIELKNIGKSYANINALKDVSLGVRQGEVTCILGDNGAGKSTLISIIAGRNFFLGSEIVRGIGPFRRLDVPAMWEETNKELHRMGINLTDLEQSVGTLSGGQRQVVAIARAIHFGARVLILDEPTAALGVAQSGIVLRYIAAAAREQGIGVIFITHNPHHAYMVGNHFLVLARGEVELDVPREDLSLEKLMFHMAGGRGLATLEHELHLVPTAEAASESARRDSSRSRRQP